MSIVVSPLTDKQLAVQALDRMPESISLEQISEELAILAALQKAQRAADEGRLISHEEVHQRSMAWTGK